MPAPRKSTKRNYSTSTRRSISRYQPRSADRKVARKSYSTYRKAHNREEGALSNIGKMAGGAIGSMFGPAGTGVGSFIGGKLGHLVGTLTGFGDYAVGSNTLMPDSNGMVMPPEVVNSKSGVIIRHREYLTDLNAQQNFTQQQYFLNPGLPASFPWLANIAAAYEEYEFRGVVVEFKSLSSDSVVLGNASSALGYVAIATQYNPASPPFFDKHELENYEYANSRKPSESFCHPVECKRRLNYDTHLYIRNGAVPAGQDQKTFDLGAVSVAVGGMQQSTGIIGELWITYEVEFFHPKYKYNAETLTDHFLRTGFTPTVPLGVISPVPAATTNGSNLGCTIVTTGSANQSIVFPQYISGGKYMVTVLWVGTASATISYPNIAFVGCQALQYWINDTAVQSITPQGGATSTVMSISWVIEPTPGTSVASAAIVFTNAGVFPTGTTNLDIWVTEMSTNIIA